MVRAQVEKGKMMPDSAERIPDAAHQSGDGGKGWIFAAARTSELRSAEFRGAPCGLFIDCPFGWAGTAAGNGSRLLTCGMCGVERRSYLREMAVAWTGRGSDPRYYPLRDTLAIRCLSMAPAQLF